MKRLKILLQCSEYFATAISETELPGGYVSRCNIYI